MNVPSPPAENELHAYVDGLLNTERRIEIESFLARDLETAARVAAWRHDAEMLRADLAGALAQPIRPELEPAAIRSRLRARSRVRLLAAASLMLVLGLGGVGGWQARALMAQAAPMADAVEAYRVFAIDNERPVEMSGGNAAVLQAWVSARLGRPISLPDLHLDGFRLLGGRLLSTPEGPAAMVLYEDQHDGQRISLYIRHSERFPGGTRGSRRDKNLLTHYWYRDGYGFALVSPVDHPRASEMEQVLRAVS